MGCASTAGAKLCEANIEIPADICCPLTGVTMAAGITRLVFQAPAGFSIGL